MRNKLLLVLSAMAVAVTLGVASAYADVITLGDTCTADTLSITAGAPPLVSGSTGTCQATDETTSTALTYSVTSGTTFAISGGGNSLSGAINWTTAATVGGITTAYGLINVSSVSGFGGEYTTGKNTSIDLTIGTNGQVSSGQLEPVVPEPATLSLLGTGLLAMAGFFRRKLVR
jgi:hypothetical protein